MARVLDVKARRWRTTVTFQFDGAVGEECYASILHGADGMRVQAIGSSPSDALANLIKYAGVRLDKAVLLASLREMEPIVCDADGDLQPVDPEYQKQVRKQLLGL